MTDPTPAGEKDILTRILAGDEEAFIHLYRERHGPVYRFALQMSGSRSVAEDVTQEVFLALIHEVHNYDASRGTLSGYLYGMARNMVFDHLKRGRMDVPLAQAEADGERSLTAPMDASGDPLGDLTRDEAVESLRQAVLVLPQHYREVVVLCDLHEMNYQDAAKVLGCAVGTVRSRLHRARELLLKKLSTRGTPGQAVQSMNPARCYL